MNKKRIWIIGLAVLLVVALVLLLAFCNRAPQTSDPTETTAPPAPTEPEWVVGYARAAHAEAIYKTLEKDTQVQVIGQYKDYYVIAGEPHDLLVEKRFIRLENETAFESKTAYVAGELQVFASVYMRQEPAAKLSAGTKLTVLQSKDGWALIEWSEGQGYVKTSGITDNKPGTGGSSGSTVIPAVPKDGTDVDINLLTNSGNTGTVTLTAYYGPQQEADFEKTNGTVLAADVEAYITLYAYNDQLKVLEHDEEYCVILVDQDVTAKLPRQLVRLEGDDAYQTWEGYAFDGAVTFEEHQRRNDLACLKLNTKVQVLDQLPGFSYGDNGVYVVSVDGEVVYMTFGCVSKDELKPASGGSSSGSSGSSGSSSSSDVWTPPVL